MHTKNHRLLPLLLLFIVITVHCDIEYVDYMPEPPPEKEFNETYMETATNLRKKLFDNYKRDVRPVKNQSTPLYITIDATITHASINPEEQSMTVHGQLHLRWTDENLTWKREEYNDLSVFHTKQWSIWNPDIKVANSISGVYQHYELSSSADATITDDGMVTVSPTFTFKVGCKFDFSDYPSDSHTCAIRLFTLARMDEIVLHVFDGFKPNLVLVFSQNVTNDPEKAKTIVGDFKITEINQNMTYITTTGATTILPVSVEEMLNTWSTATIYISFQRVAATYGIVVVLPLFVSTLLSTFSCLIPSLAHALFINVSTVTVHILFVHDFITRVPLTAESTPLIVIYYCFSMFFTSLLALFHLSIIVFIRRQTTPVIMYNNVVAYVVKQIPTLTKLQVEASEFAAWEASLQESRAWVALFVGVILSKTLVLANLF